MTSFQVEIHRNSNAAASAALVVFIAVSAFTHSLLYADDALKPTITTDTVLTFPKAQQILVDLEEQIASAERDVKKLRTEFGRTSPSVAQAERELEQNRALRSLYKELLPLMVGPRDEKKAAAIKQLTKSVAEVVGKLNRIQEHEMPDDAMQPIRDVAQHFAMLQQQLELTKRELESREHALAESAKQLAKLELDLALPPLENAELRIFHLKYVPAASAAKAIDTLFGASDMRVAVDDRTNSLILLAKPDSLKVIDAVLMNLDEEEAKEGGKKQTQPSNVAAKKSLLLRLFWLADGLTVTDAKDPAKVLPASVLRATEKLGLTKPQLVSQTVTSLAVSKNDAAEFSAFIPALLLNQFIGLSYGGKLTLGEANNVALAMHINTRHGTNCELEGSLTMPLGHYMVLGTSDTLLSAVSTKGGATNAAAKRAIVTTDGQSDPSQEAPQQEVSGLPGDAAVPSSPAEPTKPNTVRFAFVVQVDEAESFAPEEKE